MSKLAAILMLVGMPQLSLSDSATVDFFVSSHQHVHTHTEAQETAGHIIKADLSGEVLMTLEKNMATLQM